MLLFKKLLVLLERWGLPVLVCGTALAFVAAVLEALGAAREVTFQGAWIAVRDVVTSDSDSGGSWVRGMHFMLNVTLGWAAVRVYMATAGLKWDTFSARYLTRGHIVIAAGRSGGKAGGEQGALGRSKARAQVNKAPLAIDLALALAGSGHQVVLNIPELEDGTRSQLWDAGVKVIFEDLTPQQILKATGARHARQLLAMRDSHADNLTLTLVAVSQDFSNRELECKCMIEPLALKRDFAPDEFFDSAVLPRIRVFNESELIAKQLLRDHPPDAPVALSDAGVHLLLVGLGSVGQAILVQLVRLGHYRSGKRPKVTIVDQQVEAHWAETLRARPALADWLEVELHPLRIEDVNRDLMCRWIEDERPVSMVYVCTKDELANLRMARKLIQVMADRRAQTGLQTARVVALDPAGGVVLGDFAQQLGQPEQFSLFSLVRSGPSEVAVGLLSDVDDRIARLFHEGYCREDDRKCAETPGLRKAVNNKPWEALTEGMRDANRHTADHFDVKLRAVGCRLVPKGTAPVAVFTPEEIELLARMEHDRWWADKALAGWKYAPQRNNELLLHHNMVPYEELTDEIKKLDWNSVAEMISILEGQGFVVARAAPAG